MLFLLDMFQKMAYVSAMATLNTDQVMQKIRDKQGTMGLREYALSLGITVAYLSDLYKGRREPGPKILKKFKLIKTRTTTVSYTQVKG